MASWIRGGLSQNLSHLTGQISNFTKEVLTEGTEEVDDHATELKIAQARISELEALCANQQAEYARVQTVLEETSEKLEAAELLGSAISTEYRNIVHQKEEKIQRLQHTEHDLREQISRFSSGGGAPVLGTDDAIFSSPPMFESSFDPFLSGPDPEAGAGGYHGNRLGGGSGSHEVARLQKQIDSLEAELRSSRDGHQAELVALQDAHSTKVALLKRRHKQEVERLTRGDDTLQAKSRDVTGAGSERKDAQLPSEDVSADFEKRLTALQQQLDSLQTENANLKSQLAGNNGSGGQGSDSAGRITELEAQISELGEERAQLVSGLDELDAQHTAALTQVLADRDQLRASYKQVQEQLDQLQQQAADTGTTQQTHTASNQLAASGEDQLDQSVGSLDTQEAEQQLQQLRATHAAELENVKAAHARELEHAHSSHSMDIENLHSSHAKTVEGLQSSHAGELQTVHASHSQLVQKLREKFSQEMDQLITAHAQEIDTLKAEHARLALESTRDLEAVSELQGENEQLSGSFQQLQGENEQLSGSLQQLQRENEQLKEDTEKLRSAIQQMQVDKDKLHASVQELQNLRQANETQQSAAGEVTVLRTQLAQQQAECKQHIQQLEDLDTLEQQVDEYQTTVSDLKTMCESLLSEKEADKSAREGLASEVSALRSHGEELERVKVELKAKVGRVEAEVQSLEDSRNEMQNMQQNNQEQETTELQNYRDKLKDTEQTLALFKTKIEHTERELKDANLKISFLDSTNQSLSQKLEAVKQSEGHTLSAEAEIKYSDTGSLTRERDSLLKEKDNLFTERDTLLTERNTLLTEKDTLLTERDTLTTRCEALEGEKEELSGHIDELQQVLLDLKNDHVTKMAAERADWSARVEALTSQLEESRDRDVTSGDLQSEQERVLLERNEKEREVERLKSELRTKIESEQTVTRLLDDKQGELDRLMTENANLGENNKVLTSRTESQCLELERLTQIESQYVNMCNDFEKAKEEISALNIKLLESSTTDETKEVDTATLIIIADLESEVNRLREQVERFETASTNYESEIEKLKKSGEEHEKEIGKLQEEKSSAQELIQIKTKSLKEMDEHMSELNTSLTEKSHSIEESEKNIESLKSEISSLKDKLSIAERTIHDGVTKTEVSDNERTVSNNERIGKSVSDSERIMRDNEKNDLESRKTLLVSRANHSYSDYINGQESGTDIEAMQMTVEEQSKEIASLKDRTRELTQLLAGRNAGGAAIADLHTLQTEVKALRLEKEQMIQVLNDKTRECSQLKSEVHRLMSVVSAEKSALSKLQHDNAELRQGRTAGGQEKEGMQKEAVRNLSRLIRDKEVEIEALKQKNHTLLEVLQGSSEEGPRLASLVQERDNLLQQMALFQSDREQIIAALSAKHQECLLYHAELTRLTAAQSGASDAADTLRAEHDALARQYEDKQRALVVAQEELLSLRQENKTLRAELAGTRLKCAEADGRLRKADREVQRLRAQLGGDIRVSGAAGGSEEAGSGGTTPRDGSPRIENQSGGAAASQETQPNSNSSTDQPRYHADSSADSNQPCCDCERTVAELRALLLEHEQRHMDSARTLGERDGDLTRLQQQLHERDCAADERSRELSELSARFHRTEQMLRTRDAEIGAVRKQHDAAAFTLKGLQGEVTDLRAERDRLAARAQALEQQVEMQKEANNKLSMALKDHAFELNAVKEKNNTLTRLLNQKGGAEGQEKGEMDRLLKETETLQHQAKAFKTDADQFAMALQQQQEENRDLKMQLARLADREQKHGREVERLRTHLVQVEEGYTRELLEAEEREKDLRMRLASAEDRALHASSSVDRANSNASKQLDAVRAQLAAATESCDELSEQLAAAQEQAAQYAAESNNLHLVLEQFQQEKDQQLAAEVERHLRDISALKRQNGSLQQQLQQTQAEVAESTEALQAASRLSEQLDKKEEMVSALRLEVQSREQQLSQAEARIERLSVSNSNKIDKALARNLILGYFHTPSGKKQEVINVISRALDFQGEELSQLLGEASGGWLRGLFKKVVSTQTQSSPPREDVMDKSFSEALVKFMERESTPERAPRLPAEQMSATPLSRQHSSSLQQQQHASAFNPFSTPVPVSLTASHDGGGGGLRGLLDQSSSMATAPRRATQTFPLAVPSSQATGGASGAAMTGNTLTAGIAGSVGNPMTSGAVGNPLTLASMWNPLTSASMGNPLTSASVGNPLTAGGSPLFGKDRSRGTTPSPAHLLTGATTLPLFSMATASENRSRPGVETGGPDRPPQTESALLKDVLR